MREEADAITRNAPPLPQSASDLIERRIKTINAWLNENCPECRVEQKHLDEGSRERQYWHYGYLVALADLQKLFGLNRGQAH